MDRTAARALITTTITTLGTFQAVINGSPDSFDGQSPVCLITSRSLDLSPVARGLYTVTGGVTVSIYVRRAADGASAAEDQLDALALSVARALHGLGPLIQIETSDAGGTQPPNRLIDGAVYRVERIPVTVLDEYEG